MSNLSQFYRPTSHGRTIYVDAVNGSDTIGRAYNPDRPFASLAAAQLIAVTGDWIHVRPGTYAITAPLGRTGVNWWFDEGAVVNYEEAESVDTAIWKSSGFSSVNFQVRGFGTFNRTLTAHVAGPIPSVVAVTSSVASNRIVIEGLDFTVTDTSGIGSLTPQTIRQTAGTLYVKARRIISTGAVGSGGSDTTGECIWWVNGQCHVKAEFLSCTNRAVYGEVVAAPTGDLYVDADEIRGGNGAVYDASSNSSAAMWIRAGTIRSTTFGAPAAFNNGAARVYVDTQKAFGGLANNGAGLLYVRSDKVSSSSVTTSSLLTLSGGSSWIQVNDWEGVELTDNTNALVISGGIQHDIFGGRVRGGANSNGLSVSGGTVALHNVTIDTQLNSSGNPVTKSSGTLVLNRCTLLAEGTRDSITASISQAVNVHGTLAANRPVHANVTLATDAGIIYPDFTSAINAVSVETANRVSADNALSNAVSATSSQISLLNSSYLSLVNRVSANSGVGGGGGGSVTSNEVSAVSAQAASAINVVSNAASVVSQAVSVLSQAVSVADAALSTRINTQSQSISVLSQNVSVVSNALSVTNATVSNLTSAHNAASNALSNLISQHISLVDRVSANSGGSVTSTELSAVSAQAQSAINVVSNAVSNEISNRISADNVLSNAISATSSQISLLNSSYLSLVNRVSANSGVGGGSATSTELSAVSAQAQSAINVVSNAASVVSTAASNALSVANAASNAASVVSVALLSEISNRISADNVLSNAISAASSQISLLNSSYLSLVDRVSANSGVGGGGGSVTSTELSAVSAQAASAINVVSNALSVETSNRISADNALSNSLSDATSVGSATAAELSNFLSALSANFSLLQSSYSVLSQAHSALSQNQSVMSTTVSTLISAHNALSNLVSGANLSDQISVQSQQLSVLSQQASVISNALSAISVAADTLSNAVSAAGGFQQRSWVTTGLTVSGAALVDIPSLSISCAANAMYALEGKVMFDVLTSGGGIGFGLSVPATAARGTGVRMQIICNEVQAAVHTATIIATGFAAFSAEAAGSSVVVSAFMSTINSPRTVFIDGVINTSAAGTIQLGARTSAAGAQILLRSGYARAYRVG